MNIVADQNISGLDETFGRHGSIRRFDGRVINHSILRDCDALVIRSVTQVDHSLLSDTSVSFVGSTTIGYDHVDVPWLAKNGIGWANAPGCNADAAAQYTFSMILLACARSGLSIESLRCGVIGCGNVGSRLLKMLRAMDIDTIAVDPPLADLGQTDLSRMNEIVDCDIISLHVPLTHHGDYPTYHLMGQPLLTQLKPGTLVVNASRGDVIDGAALLNHLQTGQCLAALDVWPGEPDLDENLLKAAVVGTPHVAGYSMDGKLRGTTQIYMAFLDWYKSSVIPSSQTGNGQPSNLTLPRGEKILPRVKSVRDAMLEACPVAQDDANLRKTLALEPEQRIEAFDDMRRDYSARRDIAGWALPKTIKPDLAETLEQLGFTRLTES